MRTRVLLGVALFALAVVLVGCSGKDQGGKPSTPTPTSSAPSKEQSQVSQPVGPAPAASAPQSSPAHKPPAPALTPGVPPAPTVQPAPGLDDAADPTVYVTRTGKKYHAAGCRYLSRSSIPMKLSQAKQRYGPCSVCNPPQ